MRRRCGAPAMSARMQTMIIYTASNSAAYARTRRARTQVGTALEVILLLISGLGIQFPRGAQTGFDQAKRPRSRGAASSTALSHPWWMAASPGSGNDLSCGPSHEVFVPATGAPRPSPATWKQRGCWPSMPAGPICLRSLAPISTASLRISSLATGLPRRPSGSAASSSSTAGRWRRNSSQPRP
jgi:hypothetical protein